MSLSGWFCVTLVCFNVVWRQLLIVWLKSRGCFSCLEARGLGLTLGESGISKGSTPEVCLPAHVFARLGEVGKPARSNERGNVVSKMSKD